MNKDAIIDALTALIKAHKEHPATLANALFQWDALKKDFCNNLITGKLIFDDSSSVSELINKYVNTIDSNIEEDKSIDLNIKLQKLLAEQKYEEAAKIRDYMKKNNIIIIN